MVSYANLTNPVQAMAGVVAMVVLLSCSRTEPGSGPAVRPPDSTPRPSRDTVAPPAPAPPPRPTGFRIVPIDSGPGYRQMVRNLGDERLTLLQKLNRVDLFHIRAGDSLVLPADSLAGELDLAPFPTTIAGLDSIPRFIAVSQRVQAFAAYELGHLVYWGPTSTGKKSTPTPNGLFFTNWKARETRSTDNDEWLLRWYFNIDNRRGVSFHEYDLPGVPASHACIRLLPTDAEWIYRWAEQWVVDKSGNRVLYNGTPVLLFGDYAWGKPGPWRRLATDPAAASVSGDELQGELGPVLEKIKAETRRRDSSR